MRASIVGLEPYENNKRLALAKLDLLDCKYEELSHVIQSSLPYPTWIGIGCQPGLPVAGYAIQRLEELLSHMKQNVLEFTECEAPLGLGMNLHKQIMMLEKLLEELKK